MNRFRLPLGGVVGDRPRIVVEFPMLYSGLPEPALPGVTCPKSLACGRVSIAVSGAGCRLGEALGLMWQDIADDRATFWITKSGRSRTVPLTARARNAIDVPKNGGSGSVRQSDAAGFPRRLERRQGGNRAFGRHAGRAAYPAPHLRLAAGARRDRHSPGADVARPPDAVDDHALRASGHQRSRRLRKSAGTRGLNTGLRLTGPVRRIRAWRRTGAAAVRSPAAPLRNYPAGSAVISNRGMSIQKPVEGSLKDIHRPLESASPPTVSRQHFLALSVANWVELRL